MLRVEGRACRFSPPCPRKRCGSIEEERQVAYLKSAKGRIRNWVPSHDLRGLVHTSTVAQEQASPSGLHLNQILGSPDKTDEHTMPVLNHG